MSSIPELDPRAEYIAGLRALADLIEAHESIPLPYDGHIGPISWFVTSQEDEKAVMTSIIRAVGGRWDKDASSAYFSAGRALRGIDIRIIANRETVCERRVVGTETVTKKVPVTFEEQTVEQEIVEWDCTPLLAGAS